MGDRLDYPADSVTRVTSPATVLLPASTRAIVVTSDADTWMTFDGAAAAAGEMPVLSAIPNEFAISSAPVGVTLKFA